MPSSPPKKGTNRPLPMKKTAGKTLMDKSHVYNGMRHARTDFSLIARHLWLFTKDTPESLDEGMPQTDEDLLLFFISIAFKGRTEAVRQWERLLIMRTMRNRDGCRFHRARMESALPQIRACPPEHRHSVSAAQKKGYGHSASPFLPFSASMRRICPFCNMLWP